MSNKDNKIKGMVMIQGTSSHAGKSTIAAALCRLLGRETETSPFKGWNMSQHFWKLNNGRVAGVGQALQAIAAGIIPKETMNPLLLKPLPGGNSELLVNGEIHQGKIPDNKEEYTRWGMEIIKSSLLEMQKKYNVIIMEGAGSPAEINMKDRDLANMKVASLFRTPVILVADIERGGAFASLVGTMELLPSKERELIAGFIINKFRGQKETLKPGLNFLESRTGKPVLGVMPYVEDINLPEEDILFGENEKTNDFQDYNTGRNEEILNDLDRLAEKFKTNVNLQKIKEIIKDGYWKD